MSEEDRVASLPRRNLHSRESRTESQVGERGQKLRDRGRLGKGLMIKKSIMVNFMNQLHWAMGSANIWSKTFWMFLWVLFGMRFWVNHIVSIMWVVSFQLVKDLTRMTDWPSLSKREFSSRLPSDFIWDISSFCFYSKWPLDSEWNINSPRSPDCQPTLHILDLLASIMGVSQFYIINLGSVSVEHSD